MGVQRAFRWCGRSPISVVTLLLLLGSVRCYLTDHVTWTDNSDVDLFCADNEGTSEHCVDPHVGTIRLRRRDDLLASRIAEQHGFVVVGKPFNDRVYFVKHADDKHSRPRKRELFDGLAGHPDVVSLTQERARRRTKRDYIEPPKEVRKTRAAKDGKTELHLPWRDPLYREQWYLHGGAVGGYDMNVIEAWKLGYSGKGVAVSILDDGIQRDHADLKQNYDPEASTDINDHDDDPMPQDNGDNKHGTRCAGEVASVAGNNECGVGAAFDARIGGARMLDGPVSDSVEAASLSLNPQHIDVYSASWGPEDDGRTFDGPGPLAREAFRRGILEGRGGKGNIFVWASGNGGTHKDSCSADGYTTSIYTLSISSATYDNRRPWYLEECPSSIASTYSSAQMNQPAIVTVDVPRGCTRRHTGTSASAPLAAGIIALALEANVNLTWRDMQHVVLRTANPTALLRNPGWTTNGVGRKVSSKFGYGLMDAGALVKLAKRWKPTPTQQHCSVDYDMGPHKPIQLKGKFSRNFTLTVTSACGVLYLEHIQAVITIRFSRRGDIRLLLTSPMGTRSVLLPVRRNDNNRNGFHKWPFLSVQQWGENPIGVWTLTIESDTSDQNSGTFHDWSLITFGTKAPAQPGDTTYQLPTGETLPPTVEHVQETGTVPSSTPTNVGSCDSECDASGCFESNSAVGCFRCRHFNMTLKNRSGFKCVSSCEQGYYAETTAADGRSYCRQCARVCLSCSSADSCDACHPGQLLVDVDELHFHHGQCVQQCPEGLIPDGGVRCVRPKNPCSVGHYFDKHQCLPCHGACAECHGAALTDCLTCADGYGRDDAASVGGYCRPCCKGADVATDESQSKSKDSQCVYCRPPSSDLVLSGRAMLAIAVVSIGGVLLFGLLFACFMFKDRHDADDRAYAYHKLPTRMNLSVGVGVKNGAAKKNGFGVLHNDDDSADSEADEDDTLFLSRDVVNR